MPNLLASNFRFRRSFATTFPAIEVDNLIQIQRASAATDLIIDAKAPARKTTRMLAHARRSYPGASESVCHW